MMSLGGLALGIGMLVDNAIVVLENITRHRDMKKSRIKASEDGASEVSGAIFASTLTTIAVFFPMVFVVGMAGQLFKHLAFTVIFALIASLFVALTVIPLLASRWIQESRGREKTRGFLHSGSRQVTRFEMYLLNLMIFKDFNLHILLNVLY